MRDDEGGECLHHRKERFRLGQAIFGKKIVCGGDEIYETNMEMLHCGSDTDIERFPPALGPCHENSLSIEE